MPHTDPKKQREYQRRANLRRRYGLTVDEYEAMLQQTEYSCEVCSKKFNLCVDHDHTTGRIRGILCKSCNTAIGLLGDDAEHVSAALDYLRR